MIYDVVEMPKDQPCEKYYRGCDRYGVSVIEKIPLEHPYNQLILEHYSEPYNGTFSYDNAMKVLDFLKMLRPDTNFEVIGVSDTLEDKENVKRLFLGFDVSCGLDLSFINNILMYDMEIKTDKNIDIHKYQLQYLDRAIRYFFLTKLNSNGLFEIESDAKWFLECAQAINFYEPNLWEGPNLMNFFGVKVIYSFEP